MHITEGIIRGEAAIGYTAAGLALMAIGASRMKAFTTNRPEHKPLLGMGGAFIFFVSLIPIPAFTGTCSHPCGSPLAGILLGPLVGIALTGLSLLLQAAFFAHGGFSTWGANVITLGVGGAFFGWLAFRICRAMGLPIWFAGAAGGLIGDIVTYIFAGLSLGWILSNSPNHQYSFQEYLTVIYSAYLPTQGPIAIGEMIVTGLALNYIHQQRPDVLETLGVVEGGGSSRFAALLLAAGLAVFGAGVAAWSEESKFAGMDEAVNERLAEQAGAAPRSPYLDTESMGDIWNMLLLGAGGISGFVIGRWWHLLFEKREKS